MSKSLQKEQQREVNYYLSKVFEKTEQYDLIIEKMKEICVSGVKLSDDERNLLSVGYKQHVGGKRNAWRTLKMIEEENVSGVDEEDETQKEIVNEITKQVTLLEREIREICLDFINLIDDIIKDETSEEDLVFYYKLKGDYYRYISEIESDDESSPSKNHAKVAYENAEKNVKSMSLTNLTRLGLYLNYSVFIHEILGDTELAVQVSSNCFQEAMEELDELSKEEYNDCVVILQLLRDNIGVWTSKTVDNVEEEEEEEENKN